jgi:hypothetical protein
MQTICQTQASQISSCLDFAKNLGSFRYGNTMIRYSDVSLLILCRTKSEADWITSDLGILPSQVREDKFQHWSKEAGQAETNSYTWVFNSPKDAETADPTGRLLALADAIEPFGDRLLSLDTQFKRFIDVVYHVTPQHPHGITGEFDWFRMPASLMRRFVAWNLDVSYEAFWFNHPDWVSPTNQSLIRRVLRWFRLRQPPTAPAPTVSTPWPLRRDRPAA